MKKMKNEDEKWGRKMKIEDFSIFISVLKMLKSSFFILFIFRPHFFKPSFRARQTSFYSPLCYFEPFFRYGQFVSLNLTS